ncbi:hypothetical protein [Paraflavitalea sp. CAU 1676]|uniref:hypothetical protein n=1 Tax=Paraflavitalea sp. CAU 1676 TaxID=3032598 RepID=UPI0023DAD7B4|nr:hypothetical protein [Paraflavitalea sp. CAU 1676]MDF2189277.1 hypothetical protein [Paraflavitalea sp. CAU 1676]
MPTSDEYLEQLQKYYNNYGPIMEPLTALLLSGIPAELDTAEQFDARVAQFPNMTVSAFVKVDDKYKFEDDVLLMRIPGKGIIAIPYELVNDETL